MKIDTSLPIQQMMPEKANGPRQETSGNMGSFTAPVSKSESGAVPGETLSVRDRASFSSKSLAVSTALTSSQVGTSAAPASASAGGSSSSSIVSSQAEPFLSDEEVSFFEKMMRKAVNGYTRTGSYGQGPEAGSSLAMKI